MSPDLVTALENRVAALPVLEPNRGPAAWFLDFDGVLNIFARITSGEWGEYAFTEVCAFEGLGWPICYAPRLIGLLNQLHAKNIVSFRWLTTWTHDAPTKFAPAIGLDVGRWIGGDHVTDEDGASWWKLDVIVEALDDHADLVIWTDDQIRDFRSARRIVDFLHPDQALVICPDKRKGLSPEQFDLILSALERRLSP